MCIIIRNLTGAAVSKSIAKRCVEINSDGFGIVYLDGKGSSFRTLDMVVAERILTTETRPYVAHCRYATVGEVSTDAIHPFPIGRGRYLFQNGTLSCDDQDTCDTLQLAECLRGLSDRRVAFLLQALDGCRFAVADTKKLHSDLFGEWHKDAGIEYSKRNVLDPVTYSASSYGRWCDNSQAWKSYTGKSATVGRSDPSRRTVIGVYGTLKFNLGNHSLIKGADFIGYGYTSAKRRLCIDGLPYLIRGVHQDGHNVELELYSVDDETLSRVDSLEGHPDFYKREKLKVMIDRSDTSCVKSGSVFAWVYQVGNEYDNGVYHESF